MKSQVRHVHDGRRRPRRPTSSVDITMRLEAVREVDAVSRGAHGSRVPLGRAVDLALVSEEGYLTPLGFEFWRRAS